MLSSKMDILAVKMRATTCLFLVVAAAVAADDTRNGGRIVGGSLTTINAYPFTAAVLHSYNLVTYTQYCGGAIINNRSVLSAAHCYYGRSANQFRVRVGSSWANSLGTVYNTGLIIINPLYNSWTLDSNIAMLRTATNIVFVTNYVAPVSLAGYNIPDNQTLWAVGWGSQNYGGYPSEQLRQVQIWSVNQITCRNRYAEVNWIITDNMLCAGWLDNAGRGQCHQDEGSPVLYNNLLVGIYAFSFQCGLPRYPSVNTRVLPYIPWIQTNA